MIAWLLVLLLGFASGAPAAPPSALHATDADPVSGPALAGAWTGHWAAKGSAATGSVEVIFTSGAERGPILAQFTFMHGVKTFTSRREGIAVDGLVRFEAPDDGEIVLRLEAPGRLVGDFSGGSTLPAAQGGIELTRAR